MNFSRFDPSDPASRMENGDYICVSQDDARSRIGTNSLGVRLSSSPDATWWKEIKAIDSRRKTVRNPIFTEETNHGPNIMTIAVVRTSPRKRPASPLCLAKQNSSACTQKYMK